MQVDAYEAVPAEGLVHVLEAQVVQQLVDDDGVVEAAPDGEVVHAVGPLGGEADVSVTAGWSALESGMKHHNQPTGGLYWGAILVMCQLHFAI